MYRFLFAFVMISAFCSSASAQGRRELPSEPPVKLKDIDGTSVTVDWKELGKYFKITKAEFEQVEERNRFGQIEKVYRLTAVVESKEGINLRPSFDVRFYDSDGVRVSNAPVGFKNERLLQWNKGERGRMYIHPLQAGSFTKIKVYGNIDDPD